MEEPYGNREAPSPGALDMFVRRSSMIKRPAESGKSRTSPTSRNAVAADFYPSTARRGGSEQWLIPTASTASGGGIANLEAQIWVPGGPTLLETLFENLRL
jgi:hypothetical protein